MLDKEQLIKAIRGHKLIGHGTCTATDEAYSDDELYEKLKDFSTIEDAIAWRLDMEDINIEQALNARWGEDDDPQLQAAKEWEEEKAAYAAELAAAVKAGK